MPANIGVYFGCHVERCEWLLVSAGATSLAALEPLAPTPFHAAALFLTNIGARK